MAVDTVLVPLSLSVPTVLHTLNRLCAGPGIRPVQRHRIDAVTNYVADTVTRHPGIEIPVPEPRFADRVIWLLTATLPWKKRTRPPQPPNRACLPAAHKRTNATGRYRRPPRTALR